DGDTSHLYDPAAQQALQDRIVGKQDMFAWYVSPPFMALLYLPFAALPYLLSAVAWTVFTLLLLRIAAWLARPLIPDLGARHWRFALLVAAASQPIFELLGAGQDTALSLLIWVVGVRMAVSRRDGLAGTIFALGLLKPQ